jgi:ABC-type multidrug transport system fused ATPase/permease subunit
MSSPPYSLAFFRLPQQQRKAVLAAEEFQGPPRHACLERLLERLSKPSLLEPDRGAQVWTRCLRDVRPLMVQTLLWNAVIAIALLGNVWAAQGIILAGSDLTRMVWMALLIFGVELFKNVVTYFDGLRRAQIARGIQLSLMARMNDKLLAIDRSADTELSTGNLKTLISSDVEAIEDFLTAALQNWLPTLFIAITLIPWIVWNAGWVGLLGVVVALLQVPVSISFARHIERHRLAAQAEQDALTTLIGEWVRNVRLVRFLGWQHAVVQQAMTRMRRYTHSSTLSHTFSILTYATSTSWWMLPILAMLFCFLLTDNEITLAAFFGVVWALNRMTIQIQHLPYSISLYATAFVSHKRIVRLLASPDIRDRLRPAGMLTKSVSLDTPVKIHLDGVSLVLGDTRVVGPLTTSLNLRDRTGVIGPVGSGKSLLLELIVGERAPSSGTITIEFASGVRGDLWCPEVYDVYRKQIAFSPHHPYLSNATVAENIHLGATGGSPANVQIAADLALLTPDIESFPSGVQQEVGETGINLSGGQKQRVSLARAFLSNRPIFVLDDPLSAVDPGTESALAAHIFDGTRGVVIASHRFHELRQVNRILVLDAGQIVDEGTPLMLANRKSFFRVEGQPES